MSIREEWLEIVEEVAAARVRSRSPALARLYRVAVAEARAALQSFSADIRGQADDLVHDLLHEKLDAILEARNPRGLFITAIRNAAIDLQRRDKKLAREDEAPSAERHDEGPAVDDLLASRQEAERVAATLSARERQVFAALAAGEERDDIARALGTTRANIDQIVSRTRKRLGGAS